MKKLILIGCFLFVANVSHAQWVHWGPWGFGGGGVLLLEVGNDHLFSDIGNLSWYDTTQHVWVTADTGMNIGSKGITGFTSIGSVIFCGGANTGVYSSTSNGSKWTLTENEATGISASTLTSCGTMLIGGGGLGDSGYGIYRSLDSDKTWMPVCISSTAQVLASGGRFVLGSQSFGAILSTDSGTTWHETGLTNESVFAVAIQGNTFWAATNAGHIRKSIDGGQTWTVAWNADSVIKHNISVTSFAFSGTVMFAGTIGEGILESTDSGANWTEVNPDGLEGGVIVRVNALAIYDSNLVCATDWGVAACPLSQLQPKSAVAANPPPSDTLSIYPNPATESVTISSGGTSIYGVSVLNVLGENVLDVPNTRESNISLDISKLPSGTYFLRVQTANGNEIRKIVKE